MGWGRRTNDEERAIVTAILCGMVLVIAFFIIGMIFPELLSNRPGGRHRVSCGRACAAGRGPDDDASALERDTLKPPANPPNSAR